jgi:flagellar basal-body rod protein FlgG
MSDSLYIAATAMQAHQLHVDTIANNLANLETTGFKAARVNFQDMIYREARASASDRAAGDDLVGKGAGVTVGSIAKLFTQGDLKKTDRVLDLAIQGDGFFEVTLQDGTGGFSRGGSFTVDKDGFLALANGITVKPAIHIGHNAQEVAIGADGKVMVTSGAGKKLQEVGRIELVKITDTSALVSAGQDTYTLPERAAEVRSGTPGEDGLGTIAQGSIESSNVKMIDEMVNLMIARRAYEMSVKVIQAADEMAAGANNLRR